MYALFLLACGTRAPDPGDSAADTADSASDTADSAVDTADTGDTGDTGTDDLPIPEDNVANVLGDCEGSFRQPDEYPNQLTSGDELERYTLHTPEAVCNDGTRAVMYVRPSTDPEFANVWSIHLQGGGGCSSWEECAARYCGLAYYDASKMSSAYAPLEIGGHGIFAEDDANVLSGANQVFFYYCSSDGWNGQGTVTYTPDDGTSAPYTMFEHGHTIVTSGIAELQAGVTADGGTTMPSLDDAEMVVLNGTSAGASGVRSHLDWLSTTLAPSHTKVLGIIDAANDPARDVLPEALQPQWDQLYSQLWTFNQQGRDFRPWTDESCWTFNGGGENEWLCGADSYVIRNHVTTPFFLRQDLSDTTGLADVLEIPIEDYQVYTHDSLVTLPDAGAASVEPMTVAPGVYGPNCAQHVALETDDWWRVATVEYDGVPYTFQAAVIRWYQGNSVEVVDLPAASGEHGAKSDCAAVDGER